MKSNLKMWWLYVISHKLYILIHLKPEIHLHVPVMSVSLRSVVFVVHFPLSLLLLLSPCFILCFKNYTNILSQLFCLFSGISRQVPRLYARRTRSSKTSLCRWRMKGNKESSTKIRCDHLTQLHTNTNLYMFLCTLTTCPNLACFPRSPNRQKSQILA